MILHETDRSGTGEYIYSQFDENLNFQKHTHYSYEAVYCLDGELECEAGNKKYTLTKGRGLFILPGYIHSYFTPEYSRSYLCVFSTDLLGSFYERTKFSRFSDVGFSFEGSADIDVLSSGERSVYAKQAVLYALCAEVYEQSELSHLDEAYMALTNSLSMYIQNNFQKPVRLRDIAEEFGYDYSYLSSFFNRNFGINFSAFVNKYRVQHACALLRGTGRSITDIAMESGFSTIRNFNRAFMEETGLSPRRYRETFRSAPARD